MRRTAFSAGTLCALVACSDAPSSPAPTPLIAPAAASLTLGGGSVPIPGRYIVRYRANALDWQLRVQSLTSAHGAVVERVYSAVFNGAAIQIADSLAQTLLADPNVLSVEQDQMLSIATTQTNPTWGLDRIDQRNRPLNQAYTYSSGGAGVTVYIVDTGIDFSQADFQGRASKALDVITNNGTAADCNGHGTHVAGTVGSATYGVAKQAALKAVRVLDCTGHGPMSGLLSAVDWITLNAQRPAVVNMSLTGVLSASLNAAVEFSIASGITYVVAAGNATADACSASPSSAPNAITVGATDANDAFASWSNFGGCVRILAPGMNIASLWLGNGSASTQSGTSMASPHVAGAAALYLQLNPTATPAQVRSALTSNATTGVATGVPGATPNLLLYTGFLTVQQAPVANFTSACTFLSCSFNGTSSTALANATYTWQFGDAASGSGANASHVYAAPGTYTVSLTVADINGSNTKTGTVTVGSNQPPMAIISLPISGTTHMRDWAAIVSVAFAGTANDPETGLLPGASLVWRSDRDGLIGTGTSFQKTNLSLGTHVISLVATDPQGAADTATTTITIIALIKPPPVAIITSPLANSVFLQGGAVLFVGSASDAEGVLSGASLVWRSNRDGQIGTGITFSTSALSVGQHTITLTATNPKGVTGTTTVSITIGAINAPPIAAITTPAANSSAVLGSTVSFNGSGNDPETGALSGASLVWRSSRDGQIGTGTSFSKTTLSLGAHTVTLIATDAQGAADTASTTITIVAPPNQPPTAAIASPADNSTVIQGASITFAGSANDPESGAMSGASLVWRSSRDGQIGTGTSFSKTTLSLGAHTITLTATDPQGATDAATTTITVVTPPNQPPTAIITAPLGGSFMAGSSVSFAGSGSDPESGVLGGASLVWTSSRDGQIGSGVSFAKTNLTVGTHTITLRATDAQGAFDAATTTVTIVANQPPTAAITSPSNGAVTQGATIWFAGSGNDPETGALSGASLVWTSSVDGTIGTGASFSRTDLSVGQHTITLTARDAQGATGSSTRSVTIAAVNQPPTAAITLPVVGSSYPLGASVYFSGTGTDPETGALSGASLVWTSNMAGVIGTGTSFSTTSLSTGTHVITLTATDAQGALSTATRSITITSLSNQNQAPVAAFSFVCGPNVSALQHACSLDGSSSTDDSAVRLWTWNLGNGQVTSKKTAVATFAWASPGTYQVTLTVTDGLGLTSNIVHSVIVQ